MNHQINQAVLFTKPVHHLGIDLTLAQLDRKVQQFFTEAGFRMVSTRELSGDELAARDIIKKHYLMYSKGSYGEAVPSADGKAFFKSTFGKSWDAEVAAGRMMGNPQWMKSKGIDAQKVFDLFASRSTHKIDSGLVIGWIEEWEGYVINGFYPTMEAKFNHADTHIDYHVVEFDPSQVSWSQFRKHLLGSTDASKADPESFRGRLYAEYKVKFPGADNFIHGSAGPLEGLIERINFEPNFDLSSNPVGQYLAEHGITLERFNEWKKRQPITSLGDLFDATEEKNTADIFQTLENVEW